MMHYLFMLPAAFFVPVIHEFVKAITSTLQGDPAPGDHGRLTLNPFKHFEPIGFMLMLIFWVGWGNPTPTTALHYKNRQRGVVITYVTPVLVSLLLGVGVAMMMPALPRFGGTIGTQETYFIVYAILYYFAMFNICLALFNLIPVYPLAANRLMIQFSQPNTIAMLNHHEKHMQAGLILLLAFSMLGSIIFPAASGIYDFAYLQLGAIWR